jgi:hypothetical protein
MKSLTLVIVFLASILSTALQAKYITSLGGPGVEITRVFIHSSGAISLNISGQVDNLDQCTSSSRVYIPHDVAGKDQMLSTALTAFATGQKVGFHGSGCNTTAFWGGTVDVPIVNNMWVSK